MQAVNRLTIIAIAFVLALGAGLGIFLYISLIPHFTLIGWVMAGVVVVGLGCTVALMVSFTFHKIGTWSIGRNTLVAGEVVSYRNDDGTWTHLSAEHERAKVIPQVAISKQPEQDPLPSEAWVVIDMHRQGIGFKRIAEATLWTEYEVRKLCNKLDGKT